MGLQKMGSFLHFPSKEFEDTLHKIQNFQFQFQTREQILQEFEKVLKTLDALLKEDLFKIRSFEFIKFKEFSTLSEEEQEFNFFNFISKGSFRLDMSEGFHPLKDHFYFIHSNLLFYK